MVLVGGIGYVVPVGGLEITGVLLELFVSLALHAVNNSAATRRRVFTQRRKDEEQDAKQELPLCAFVVPLRLCVKLALIFYCRIFILVLWDRLAGHTILALDPPAEIY